MFKNSVKVFLGISAVQLTFGVSVLVTGSTFATTASAATTFKGYNCKRLPRQGDRTPSISIQGNDGKWRKLTGWNYYNGCKAGGTIDPGLVDGFRDAEAVQLTSPVIAIAAQPAVVVPTNCPPNTKAQPNGTCLATSSFSLRQLPARAGRFQKTAPPLTGN